MRVLLLEVRQFVEEATDLARREPLVDHPPERRQLLGATRCAARRHHRLLVPAEDRARPGEVADLREASAQLVEGLGHGREPYRTITRVWLANSLVYRSGIGRYSRWRVHARPA